MEKKKLLISFSGGATSGYMLRWILDNMSEEYEFKIIFANTGLEDEDTLLFVKRIADYWNIEIIWVEGYPNTSKGWGVIHKVVTFETASRDGEPFEAMIAKLGIPSTNAPFCSAQLKRAPIASYLRSIGWRKYYKAIGIRADEVDRMSEHHIRDRIIYPLVKTNTTKVDVGNFWADLPYKFNVHPDLGNCAGCWKKDFPRLIRIAKNFPEKLDWWIRMTAEYGNMNPRNISLKPPFNFYRGNISPTHILEMVHLTDFELLKIVKKQKLNSCSESCEAY